MEFDKFWPEHSKVSLILTLMGFLWPNYLLFKLKKYVGFIFHETEEGYKIWSGNNLWFQNWHKEFEKFSPEHLKGSNSFTSMGFFWAKYILFKLKMYIRVIFHETEEGWKIWGGIDFVPKLTSGIWQILTWALQGFTNFHFNGLLLSKVYIVQASKSTQEFSFMKLNRDTKFGEESTCRFKIDKRKLTNFHLSTQKF